MTDDDERWLPELLREQGKAAFGHAFGRTMLLGSLVILVNATIVWTLQGRHRSAVAPEPAVSVPD